MDHLIQKRDDLLRGLVQLADEPVLYKPSGGDNIEVRYHLNVGVRSVKRAYLLTYLLGGAFPDYSSLLGDIAALYKNAEYTSDGGTCTVSIGGTQAAELLKALCHALSGDTETVEDAYAETVIENGAVRSITVSVAGTIEGTAFEVSAVIDGITRYANHNIPEKVSVSAAVAIQNGSAPQFPDKAVSVLTQEIG